MTFSRENSAEQWPLEAERLSLDDPLMECLAIISAEHGRRITVAALSAGLPLPGKAAMASPAVFIRAAERVRMKARLVRSPLPTLAEKYNLPCIVALKDNRACILRGYADDRVVVTFPETPGERTTLPLSVLRERYLGYAFFVRPQGYVD
jgi:ATP-binding cassette, subfamily C, bacterial LapB